MIAEAEKLDQVLERRRIAVQRTMAERNLSALFMYGISSYAGSGAAGHGYIRYLTDWTARFAPSALILPAEGRPTLLIPSGYDGLYVNAAFPWVEKGIPETPPNYGKLARQVIGQPKGKVGLIGQGDFPSAVYTAASPKVTTSSLRMPPTSWTGMRAIKDDFEMSRHRRAAEISDLMYERLLEVLPGFSGPVWQLMAAMESAGRGAGAELATVWLSTGQPPDRQKLRFEENEHPLERGDQIHVGTYVTYRGYWAHSLRMGSVGKPNAAFQRTYDAVFYQHSQTAALIQDGLDAADIQMRADELANSILPGGDTHPVLFASRTFLRLGLCG